MLLGLVAAFGAAVAYGVASVLQAVGARRLESGSVDAAFLLRLTRSLPYVTGLALDGAGFVATVVALRVLPLFVVESAVASSVGVTALVAARFAGVGVAARALQPPPVWWHLLGEPLLWALVVGGAAALVAYATALQRGAVTVVAAVTFAVETVVPAVVGYALLGDRARPGWLPVAVAGLLLTLGGAIALSRHSEPEAAAAA